MKEKTKQTIKFLIYFLIVFGYLIGFGGLVFGFSRETILENIKDISKVWKFATAFLLLVAFLFLFENRKKFNV